jgi:LacI family transcriptional regulator
MVDNKIWHTENLTPDFTCALISVTFPVAIPSKDYRGGVSFQMSNRKNITIHDVAAAAGVSISTVSRVLNNKDDVSAETSQNVQRVVAELGYASSLAARGMRSRRTKVIGLIMPDVAEPYSYAVLQGVNRAIAQLDYDLIVYTNGDISKNTSADQERYYVSLLNGSITDGVIVVSPAATSFSTDAPLVAIDPNNESPGCPAIIATNHKGALEVMQYLTSLGHRRIGFIAGREELVSSQRRLQGYRDGLAVAGVAVDEELIQVGEYSYQPAIGCTNNLLSLSNPPTAIFAANDRSAKGVYQAAADRGLRIPDDLSVVGFDNSLDASLANPELTTVDQFVAEMGYLAIEMVMKLINGETLENDLHKIQTQLVVRDSCKQLV